MGRDRYGNSSHTGYMPGLGASPVDQYLIHPKTSWRGVRGASPTFSMRDEERLDPSLLHDDLIDFDIEEELSEELGLDDEEMGRLYAARSYGRPIESSRVDPGVIRSKSSRSGYRGARDRLQPGSPQRRAQPAEQYRYGADDREMRFGPLEYRGGVETLMLSAAVVALLFRMADKGRSG